MKNKNPLPLRQRDEESKLRGHFTAPLSLEGVRVDRGGRPGSLVGALFRCVVGSLQFQASNDATIQPPNELTKLTYSCGTASDSHRLRRLCLRIRAFANHTRTCVRGKCHGHSSVRSHSTCPQGMIYDRHLCHTIQLWRDFSIPAGKSQIDRRAAPHHVTTSTH